MRYILIISMLFVMTSCTTAPSSYSNPSSRTDSEALRKNKLKTVFRAIADSGLCNVNYDSKTAAIFELFGYDYKIYYGTKIDKFLPKIRKLKLDRYSDASWTGGCDSEGNITGKGTLVFLVKQANNYSYSHWYKVTGNIENGVFSGWLRMRGVGSDNKDRLDESNSKYFHLNEDSDYVYLIAGENGLIRPASYPDKMQKKSISKYYNSLSDYTDEDIKVTFEFNSRGELRESKNSLGESFGYQKGVIHYDIELSDSVMASGKKPDSLTLKVFLNLTYKANDLVDETSKVYKKTKEHVFDVSLDSISGGKISGSYPVSEILVAKNERVLQSIFSAVVHRTETNLEGYDFDYRIMDIK